MKSKNIIITIIILILIVLAVSIFSNKKTEQPAAQNEKTMIATTSKQLNNVVQETVSVKSGIYEVYSPEKIANAKSGAVVLFFKADWCPSCRTVDADITSNLTLIPENLTILDVDYDTNKDLRKKYGVTYQHTFVQVDADGNMIKKWSGGSTLNSIVKEII